MGEQQGRPVTGRVVAVHTATTAPTTGFAKATVEQVELAVDHGVAGDRHAGRRDARLRQVHLVDVARYELLQAGGADVGPGRLGENVTTRGVDLLGLGLGGVLRLGPSARVRLTGCRWPRHDDPTVAGEHLHLDPDGVPVGRVGVFAVVLVAGTVRAEDPVVVLDPGDGTALPPL